MSKNCCRLYINPDKNIRIRNKFYFESSQKYDEGGFRTKSVVDMLIEYLVF